jgi:hypothetical protein
MPHKKKASRALTAKEFFYLADVPPEIEWFANTTNPRPGAHTTMT